MKRNSHSQGYLFFSLTLLLFCSGCDKREPVVAPIIITAFFMFIFGTVLMSLMHRFLDLSKVREYLKRSSPIVKICAMLLGCASIALIVYGFFREGLHFYNVFLGCIMLYVSHRLFQSAKCWESENWVDAKHNTKLIMFSLGICIAIVYLIYADINLKALMR